MANGRQPRRSPPRERARAIKALSSAFAKIEASYAHFRTLDDAQQTLAEIARSRPVPGNRSFGMPLTIVVDS